MPSAPRKRRSNRKQPRSTRRNGRLTKSSNSRRRMRLCRTRFTGRANGLRRAIRWSCCCRRQISRCGFSCRKLRWRKSKPARASSFLRRRGEKIFHDRELHFHAVRVHAAGFIQPRESREAGLHDRGEILARGCGGFAPRPAGGCTDQNETFNIPTFNSEHSMFMGTQESVEALGVEC